MKMGFLGFFFLERIVVSGFSQFARDCEFGWSMCWCWGPMKLEEGQ